MLLCCHEAWDGYVCVQNESEKWSGGSVCVFACMCTRLHAHAPPVHYWPAAEASHFPVFIKTWPIKFYLQSIIRTPQINQRQLNQCFPGPVPGPHGPHGHSIFSAGLIHGGLQWSHTEHPLACSWLLDSTVPRSWLRSTAYGGSPLRGIGFDFINSPVEVRDEEMNAMFHLVLSGHVGQRRGGFWNVCHFFGTKGAVTQHAHSHVSPCLQHTVCQCVVDVSLFLVMLTCGSAWQRWRTMAHTQRHRYTHAYSPSLSHLHTHRVSDGFAIDRATEIIKCCPTGSSIRHWQWQDEAVVRVHTHTRICTHTQTYTHRWTHPHPLSVTASQLRTWISLSSFLSPGLFLSLCLFIRRSVCECSSGVGSYHY